MTIIHDIISIPGGTPGLAGYLAWPEDDTVRPGLVIIHEIFGLNDDIRAIADRFAQEGYAVLAVDLFAGRNRAICMFRFMAGMLTNSLDHGGIHDLKTALNWLSAQPFVDADRVGAVGFCMGGNFAISWACRDSRLRVVAPFYAMNPRPLAAVERLCPVVGSYPENDFSANAARQLESQLEQQPIVHDIVIYPGATHSFFNGRREQNDFNREAARDSWERTIRFLAEMLRGNESSDLA